MAADQKESFLHACSIDRPEMYAGVIQVVIIMGWKTCISSGTENAFILSVGLVIALGTTEASMILVVLGGHV